MWRYQHVRHVFCCVLRICLACLHVTLSKGDFPSSVFFILKSIMRILKQNYFVIITTVTLPYQELHFWQTDWAIALVDCSYKLCVSQNNYERKKPMRHCKHHEIIHVQRTLLSFKMPNVFPLSSCQLNYKASTAAQRLLHWVLKACMGSGCLRHASTLTALLCSTKGTAPGEPIKSVLCVGDSCSSHSPESLTAPHHHWGNTVGEERVRRGEGMTEDSSQPEEERTGNPLGGLGTTVRVQVVYSQSHLHWSCGRRLSPKKEIDSLDPSINRKWKYENATSILTEILTLLLIAQ